MKNTMTGRLAAILCAGLLTFASAAPLSAQQGGALQLSALSGEEALLPRLNGLRLVATAPGLATSRQTGIEIAPRLQAPQEAQLSARMNEALGRPASLESLDRVVNEVRRHFREAGYPFTLVTLPEQDITHGSVAILVQPSRLAQEPSVDGARYFDPESYQQAIRVRPGQTINADTLEADLSLLNANPYRQVSVVSRPGAEPATTQLTLITQEERPYGLNLGISTEVFQGESSTTLNGSAVFGDFLGRGDLLSYNLGADPDNASSMAHSLTFSHFMRGNRRLETTAYYTRPENELSGIFRQIQTTARLGLTYHADREVAAPGQRQEWYVGIEGAKEDYELQFFGTPVSDTHVDLFHLKAGWARAVQLKMGQRSYGVDVLLSPGGLTPGNSNARFDETRPGASASYLILRPRYSQTVSLGEGRSWSLRARGQVSTGKLVQSQQFNAVSETAVRLGDTTVYGDHGAAFQNTLTLPLVSIGSVRLSPRLMGDVAAARWAGRSSVLDDWRVAGGLGGGLGTGLWGRANLSLEAGQLWWQVGRQTKSEFAVSFGLNIRL